MKISFSYIYDFYNIRFISIYPPLGEEIKGARRWLDIGFMTIMPSDIIKIGSIIFFLQNS